MPSAKEIAAGFDLMGPLAREIDSICTTISYAPARVVGRIDYPGDRTTRHTRGDYITTLELVMHDGLQLSFDGEAAEAIALILATEIP